MTPENTIHWYEQGAKDTWTSKIGDKLVEQAVKEKNTFKEPEVYVIYALILENSSNDYISVLYMP